ncbi:LPS assembly protein LptD [Methylomonas sp. HYX-M1]|uniref:LPS-assembly protein LptD n=1 Tax=Methylomonas sp. HYX-M1 TaxID=3139307 RepID=UPI00345BD10F
MTLRLYPIYLALLSVPELSIAANNAVWNCEQGPNGQWSCLNQDTPEAPPQPGKDAAGAQQRPVEPTPAQNSAETKPLPQAPGSHAVPEAPGSEPAAPVAAAPISPKQALEQALPKKLHARIGERQKPVVEEKPPAKQAASKAGQIPGWTCKGGEENANWNCNLVGQDPKGEAQVVADTTPASYWFNPTYSLEQERAFQTLRGEFQVDPWLNCGNWSAKKNQATMQTSADRENASTDVIADSSEVFDGEILNFAGNVDLKRADQHLLADKASYDTVAQTLDAQGNIVYSENALAIASDTVSLSLNKDEARMRNAQFIVAEAPLRGSAQTMYRDSAALSRYNEATFTSCPPGNQDWIAHASRIKINRETGKGSAKNAWLEFKGVPVLYTPYISFPTDGRRTTGLLAPTWATTQRNGFDFSAPVYLNIAPNIDDTITPRFMEKRGQMLRNKFRYLTETSYGYLGTEILPHDQIKDKSRYSATFRDVTQFTPHLSSHTNLNYVSDKEYFNDLNNALGFQTNRFLTSTAFLNYDRSDLSFATGIQHYQSVDKTIANTGVPYDILPRVSLNYDHDFENLPVTIALHNQYSHFFHNDLINGQRFNIAPSLSLPLETSAGFFIPKITGQYTQYSLSNQTNASQPDSVSRTLPIFSVDSGVNFERDMLIGNSSYVHTFEPRAFYLYIPRKDQSDIPIFDTAAYDTNYYSLFRENSFSGLDRIQDANQITLAASSRFIDSATGLEPLKISVGQILYFQDRTVNLPGIPVQTSSTSNFVGELAGQLTRNLSYTTGAQWDPEANGIARGLAMLKYRNQPDQILDLGYRYRRNTPNDQSTLSQTTISQTDMSFRWPLAAGWYGLGRWQYSFNFDKTTESFIGIEKETCCWRLRLIGRRYINGARTGDILAPDAKPENAVFVQLELKGLTSFGDSVDAFLQRNLNGYHPASYFED